MQPDVYQEDLGQRLGSYDTDVPLDAHATSPWEANEPGEAYKTLPTRQFSRASW